MAVTYIWKARWLQSLISSHVTSPPAFSCTLHRRGKLCARLHVWANQFDNTKTKHSLVHLVVAAFSGAKTHPPQAGQPVLELALSAETSAIGVNWADRRGAIHPGPSSITKYSILIKTTLRILYCFFVYLSQPLTLGSMRNSRSACRSRQTPGITFEILSQN